MNLQRKVAPERYITTQEGLRSAFTDGLITKSAVLSRMAEFYDPAGWWEPLRLQLKLLFHELISLDWNDPIPDEFHEDWIEAFLVMEKSRALRIPRCVVPESVDPRWRIRLICLADAAEGAGGCAIYGGVELPDGTYSCHLLLAKSRLMKHSVPRNKLEAILLMSDAALEVAQSLGNRLGEVLYYSDSAVALCWVLNSRKRLRMFVHNRVRSIRYAIRQVVNGEERIPLFHIDWRSNLADMLTKPGSLQQLDIGINSQWQNGLDWMRLPTSTLPRSQEVLSPSPEVDDLVWQEVFEDMELHSLQVEVREMLHEEFPISTGIGIFSASKVDLPRRCQWLHDHFPFVHLGWQRAFSRLQVLSKAMLLLLHRRHDAANPKLSCTACTGRLAEAASNLALQTVVQAGSEESEFWVGRQQLSKIVTLQSGVWYTSRRLEKEGLVEYADLDFAPFYDGHFQQVIRSKKLARQMVYDLRAFFASCSLGPDRDPGWVDHWALDTRKLESIAKSRIEEAKRQEDRALALGAQARHAQTSAQNLLGSLARIAAGYAVIPDLAAAARGSTGQSLPVMWTSWGKGELPALLAHDPLQQPQHRVHFRARSGVTERRE